MIRLFLFCTLLFSSLWARPLHWESQDIDALFRAIGDLDLNYRRSDYLGSALRSAWLESERNVTDRMERIATRSFRLLCEDTQRGAIDWDTFEEALRKSDKGFVWEETKKTLPCDKLLKQGLRTHTIYPLLKSLLPKDPGFWSLLEAYRRLERLERAGGLPKVSYGPELKEGDYGARTVELKRFLLKTGDLNVTDRSYLEFPTFDHRLKEALLRFQKRHYLKATGILDNVTVLYTRTPLKKRLRTIALNLERYKHQKELAAPTRVVVNVPAFNLRFFEENTPIRDIFVVVGREDRPTPIFDDRLEYIVLNPTWSVPQNLLRKDYLPKLVQDPHAFDAMFRYYRGARRIDPATVRWRYYLEHNRTTIPIRLVQPAGERNVLGRMKFIFPNRYHVYLHDTDDRNLTDDRYRLYSSGCIRLHEPYTLLGLLAPYTGHSYEALVAMIDSGKTHRIALRRPIPISIRYFTAYVDDEGELNFRRDFYGFDRMQHLLKR